MTHTDRSRSRVPFRALALSLAALAVPVVSTFLLPGWAGEDQGVLIWLTSLVPAFLLAYYRGLKGVALALAGGMAVLSLTQAAVLALGVANPNWAVLLGVVLAYVAISIGIAVFAEILHRERRAAEEMALVDRLTGLSNRRHAELALESEFAAAIRGRRLAVIVFDLDHFKRVNDRNGHDAGDEALRAFANILKRATRRMNVSARFGGEEFISILADCDPDAAVDFADRVRKEMKATTFPWGRVTVSAGGAAYQEGMGSYEVLVAAADRALYGAKEGGRDRVEMAQDAPTGVATAHHPASPCATRSVRVAGKETILLIDDDRSVRSLLARGLGRAGYQVEEYDDPEEVVRRCSDSPDNIDLLITDIMMPKLNGLTLADRVSRVAPDLPVMFMSGYVHGQVSWAGLPKLAVGFLEKPIKIATLVESVGNALAEQPVTA